jgi:hypothetical protein
MRSWVKRGERPGQTDRTSAKGCCLHYCTYNLRKLAAGSLLVVPAQNQEKAKQRSWPCVALVDTASPLRLMGPKWSALGRPLMPLSEGRHYPLAVCNAPDACGCMTVAFLPLCCRDS